MKEISVSIIILLWILIIGGNLTFYSISNNKNGQLSFYNIGPNSQLIILNIVIDTPLKYCFVILYSIFNNIIRNLNSNILRSWITHNIQDNTDEGITRKLSLNYIHAHQINTIYTVYGWFDFLIYIHLLLSQIDIFFIEATTDVVIVFVITNIWYLQPNPSPPKTPIDYETDHLINKNVADFVANAV